MDNPTPESDAEATDEPFEKLPRADEFVLDEKDEAKVLQSRIVDQVDDLLAVLRGQIVRTHNDSNALATIAERQFSSDLICKLAQMYYNLLSS